MGRTEAAVLEERLSSGIHTRLQRLRDQPGIPGWQANRIVTTNGPARTRRKLRDMVLGGGAVRLPPRTIAQLFFFEKLLWLGCWVLPLAFAGANTMRGREKTEAWLRANSMSTYTGGLRSDRARADRNLGGTFD